MKYCQFSSVADSAFANLPTHYNSLVIPKSILIVLSWSFRDKRTVARNSNHPKCTHVSSRGPTGQSTASLFQLTLRTSVLFMVYAVSHISHIYAVCLLFHCSKWPQSSAEVVPHVPKHKKAKMCLTEKIVQLHLGPSYIQCCWLWVPC